MTDRTSPPGPHVTPGDVGCSAVCGQSGLMAETLSVPADELTPGRVRRAGGWAVGNRDGELFTVVESMGVVGRSAK